MLHTCVVVEPPPPVAVLPPEPEPEPEPELPPDEDEPPLVDVPPEPDEARGGFAHDSSASTILNVTLVAVLYVPAEGLCEHTFQLVVCTTERPSSLASLYDTDLTWCPRASATALWRFHPA